MLEQMGLRQGPMFNSKPIVANANIRVLGLEKPGSISVAINDVVRGKPVPEPYARVATLLNVEPSECIVIQDSPTGAQADLAAGA